ncbi:MAG: hypothetical protein PWP31_889 [Clostridia bacterium]|nr:hypothetical protein [Clostridia bacterium]
MIRKVSNIMVKDFITVNSLDGVKTIKDIALEKGISYFPVMENDRVIGVITNKELIKAHPNRIAADAMTDSYVNININTSIWEAKELFEKKNVDILLVEQNNEVVGLITESVLDIELGKHIDLLTGLYKSDYIFYNAAKLIKNGNEISIIFIDVDNFSCIDKEYGHICGDKILKQVAVLLDRHKPKDTYLCRFGGDEFIVLTPYYMEQAKDAAKRLLDAVSEYPFLNEIKVTMSAGIVGGRRYNRRITEVYKTVSNLINIASLASAKAKKTRSELSIVYEADVNEIA